MALSVYEPTDSPDLDAVAADREHHEVLIENERVRVLRVRIPPGVKENAHTHRWWSVFVLQRIPEFVYYGRGGELVELHPPPPDVPMWLPPEGPHAPSREFASS